MPTITKDQILAICDIIDKTTLTLNHGGCGVFAYLLGSQLEKFDNCKVKVRVINFWSGVINLEKAVPKKPSNIYNWHGNGVNFDHVVLEVTLDNSTPFLVDSTGEYRSRTPIDGSIPLCLIKEIVQQPKGWNKEFDRRQIPRIMYKIRKFFKPYKIMCNNLFFSEWDCKPKSMRWMTLN